MKPTLIIPKLCKVGFNKREDTYTGKLGYIIYYDGKVWRKEKSWESWRQLEMTEENIKMRLDQFNQRYHYQYPMSYPLVTSFEECDKILSKHSSYITKYRHGLETDVEPIEFTNELTEGFVLNKKTGDHSNGFNHRNAACRVYDPRGWEFEISIQNLLYILENTNCIKGKGLEGNFIYAWDKAKLVLLPEDSIDYKQIIENQTNK